MAQANVAYTTTYLGGVKQFVDDKVTAFHTLKTKWITHSSPQTRVRLPGSMTLSSNRPILGPMRKPLLLVPIMPRH
eukprot:scaffold6824_cov43-Attheya_sp.AAC.2